MSISNTKGGGGGEVKGSAGLAALQNYFVFAISGPGSCSNS